LCSHVPPCPRGHQRTAHSASSSPPSRLRAPSCPRGRQRTAHSASSSPLTWPRMRDCSSSSRLRTPSCPRGHKRIGHTSRRARHRPGLVCGTVRLRHAYAHRRVHAGTSDQSTVRVEITTITLTRTTVPTWAREGRTRHASVIAAARQRLSTLPADRAPPHLRTEAVLLGPRTGRSPCTQARTLHHRLATTIQETLPGGARSADRSRSRQRETCYRASATCRPPTPGRRTRAARIRSSDRRVTADRNRRDRPADHRPRRDCARTSRRATWAPTTAQSASSSPLTWPRMRY